MVIVLAAAVPPAGEEIAPPTVKDVPDKALLLVIVNPAPVASVPSDTAPVPRLSVLLVPVNVSVLPLIQVCGLAVETDRLPPLASMVTLLSVNVPVPSAEALPIFKIKTVLTLFWLIRHLAAVRINKFSKTSLLKQVKPPFCFCNTLLKA